MNARQAIDESPEFRTNKAAAIRYGHTGWDDPKVQWLEEPVKIDVENEGVSWDQVKPDLENYRYVVDDDNVHFDDLINTISAMAKQARPGDEFVKLRLKMGRGRSRGMTVMFLASPRERVEIENIVRRRQVQNALGDEGGEVDESQEKAPITTIPMNAEELAKAKEMAEGSDLFLMNADVLPFYPQLKMERPPEWQRARVSHSLESGEELGEFYGFGQLSQGDEEGLFYWMCFKTPNGWAFGHTKGGGNPMSLISTVEPDMESAVRKFEALLRPLRFKSTFHQDYVDESGLLEPKDPGWKEQWDKLWAEATAIDSTRKAMIDPETCYRPGLPKEKASLPIPQVQGILDQLESKFGRGVREPFEELALARGPSGTRLTAFEIASRLKSFTPKLRDQLVQFAHHVKAMVALSDGPIQESPEYSNDEFGYRWGNLPQAKKVADTVERLKAGVGWPELLPYVEDLAYVPDYGGPYGYSTSGPAATERVVLRVLLQFVKEGKFTPDSKLVAVDLAPGRGPGNYVTTAYFLVNPQERKKLDIAIVKAARNRVGQELTDSGRSMAKKLIDDASFT